MKDLRDLKDLTIRDVRNFWLSAICDQAQLNPLPSEEGTTYKLT